MGLAISVGIATMSKYMDYEWMHLIFKSLSTILVILLPIVYAKNGLKPFKNIVIIGLVFCLLGDVFLIFDDYFIQGLGAFLICHLILIYGYSTIRKFSFNLKTLIPLIAVAVFAFMMLKDHLGSLLIPVMLYMTCIMTMVWQALNLCAWKRERGFLLIAVGACLFMLSDMFLAYREFVGTFYLDDFWVYITYWPAIALIALSTLHIGKRHFTDEYLK